MSDLSNLLGAVYGSNDPDGPSTRHEPSAAERTAQPAAPRIDDDLAAALSAALVSPTPEANMATPAYAPAPAPAPAMPAAAAPVAQPAYAPTYNTGTVSWSAGDDDIFPSIAGKKR